MGIIRPRNLTTLLSVSIVDNPICSQTVSALAMKRRLRKTGKRVYINALVVPVMAARSDPRVAVDAEAVVKEETPIGARLLGCI